LGERVDAERALGHPTWVTQASRLATYGDLLALGEEARAEIVSGQIVTAPAPLPRHSNAQGSLRRFVGGPFHDDDGRGGPGGWWIFVEVDIRFSPHDIVRPDIAGWRRARLPRPGSARPIDVAPDWVCEITSPTTRSHDRVTKRGLYARHAVPYYWMVDPEARTLEALELENGRWVELGAWDEGAVARIPPFAEIELEVARLFLPRGADEPSEE
jgi:Uma2 family endonuclease